MSEKIKFLMTFRARLMLLLTSFLLLTIVLVIVLDKWAQKRADVEVERQSQQVKEAVSSGFGDLAQAFSLAITNLNSETYLYDKYKPEQMPPSIEHIIVTDKDGNVNDTTLPELRGKQIPVPERPDDASREQIGDPVEQEIEFQPHEGLTRTYNISVMTARGLYWIVIVQQQQGIINKIDSAQKALASKNRQLSNFRIAATSGLLALALGIAVVIGWRFTRPIKELAAAARRIAAGNLNFHVAIDRPDEVGQLATTFNEMITELRSKHELEEKLNQAERAATIGRLTQAVAHEIRNPLNVINLSIDHASSKFAPEDETRGKQFRQLLSSIKDEIARLNRMVNDVLNYGRPSRLSVDTIDMRELVSETIALVRPQADEQKVEIAFPENGEAAEVRGDRERLKSCLSNIAINALQAMPAGGHLTARVEETNGIVEVSFTDTGIGIAEEAIGKIFEPYFSTKQTGFGLGLAVTKKIVEDHNGSIGVKSEPDSGTIFTVRLPAADSKAKDEI